MQPAPQINIPKQLSKPPANQGTNFQQQIDQFKQQLQQGQNRPPGRIKNPQPTIPGIAPPLVQNPTGTPNIGQPNLPDAAPQAAIPTVIVCSRKSTSFREQLAQPKTGQPGQPVVRTAQPGGRVKNPGEGQPFIPGQSDTLKPVIPGQAPGLKPATPGQQLGNGQNNDFADRIRKELEKRPQSEE